jgi:hypothetical protein
LGRHLGIDYIFALVGSVYLIYFHDPLSGSRSHQCALSTQLVCLQVLQHAYALYILKAWDPGRRWLPPFPLFALACPALIICSAQPKHGAMPNTILVQRGRIGELKAILLIWGNAPRDSEEHQVLICQNLRFVELEPERFVVVEYVTSPRAHRTVQAMYITQPLPSLPWSSFFTSTSTSSFLPHNTTNTPHLRIVPATAEAACRCTHA